MTRFVILPHLMNAAALLRLWEEMQDTLLCGVELQTVQRTFSFLKNMIMMSRDSLTILLRAVKKVKNIISLLMQKVSDIPKLWHSVLRQLQELRHELPFLDICSVAEVLHVKTVCMHL